MSDRQILYFQLLGSFSYGSEECIENEAEIRAGKKTRSFLQYLLAHHERSISSEELIQTFWPEHEGVSADTLRRMLHNIRKLLKSMFPGQVKVSGRARLRACFAGFSFPLRIRF